MKKIFIIGMVAALVTTAVFAKPAVSVDAIPQAAKDFIAKNFAGRTATYAEAGNKEWEVVLDDGTEIKFSATGEWEKVESRAGVPASILPDAVAKQVAITCPDEAIVEIEKKRGTYEVKVASFTELRISENGTLLEQKTDHDARVRKSVPAKPVQPNRPDASSGASKRGR